MSTTLFSMANIVQGGWDFVCQLNLYFAQYLIVTDFPITLSSGENRKKKDYY